jgi:hypothetical protein
MIVIDARTFRIPKHHQPFWQSLDQSSKNKGKKAAPRAKLACYEGGKP